MALAVAGELALAGCGWAAVAAEPAKNPAAGAPTATAPATDTARPSTPVPNTQPAPVPSPSDIDEHPNEGEPSESSGLPVPRFVSLRSDSVNMRSGPGLRYPIAWVYRRRHLPVEVIAEFDTWRRIRDPDGAEGWVHQSMLTGRRTAIVRGTAQALQRSDGDSTNPVATLEGGVIVNLERCPAESASCRVDVNGLQGWLKRDQIWGIYPTETVE